jgi:hypothetical protein
MGFLEKGFFGPSIQMIRPIRFPSYYILLLIPLLISGRLKADESLVIDYFFESGCLECREISENILPALSNLFYGTYILNYRDLSAMTNYLDLVRCQQTANSTKNEPVYMAVNNCYLFSGLSEITSDFLNGVDEIIHKRAGTSAVKSSAVAVNLAKRIPRQPAKSRPVDFKSLLNFRFRQFTVYGVMLAGLIDGLNPCAISTLVFFISILSLSKFRHHHIIFAGIWFCGASFITYTAIGFGLFHFLHNFANFFYLRLGLELGMGGILVLMAALSFYDAWKYHRSGNLNSVTLKLPSRVKRIMNAIMMRLPKARHVPLVAFLIGVAVTALETVCTGQVYVPTLVLMIKSGASHVWGMIYLFLYNLMFILPLVIALTLAMHGMKVQRLIAWSKREVVISKIAMACLFMVLAFVLIFLR